MSKKQAILLTFLTLIFLTSTILMIPKVYSQKSWEWILETRGKDFEIYTNSSDVTTKMHKNAATWVWNGNSYAPYVYFRDDAKKCYRVQTGLISGEIYDSGVATFYDVDLNEQRIKSEIWEVWVADKKATLNSPVTFNIIQNSSGVYINSTRTTSKPPGVLTIIYCFRVGSCLKHWVFWESNEATKQTVKIKQVWDLPGFITKCKVDHVETSVSGTYDGTQFLFYNETNSFLVFEDQSKMFVELQPTAIDFAGKKVSFTFGNWTLENEEKLVIDPTTSTEKPSTAENKAYTTYPSTEFTTPEYTNIQTDNSVRVDIATTTNRFSFNVSEYNTGSNTIKYLVFQYDGSFEAYSTQFLYMKIQLEGGSWSNIWDSETAGLDYQFSDGSGWEASGQYTSPSNLPSDNIYNFNMYCSNPANLDADTVELQVIYGVTELFTSTTLDGYLQKYSATSYADCQSATPTVRDETFVDVGQYYAANEWCIWRAYISFDTSSIPDGATITGAELKLWVQGDFSDTDFNVNVYDGTQPIWGDTLTASDWDCGTNSEGIILATANAVKNYWFNISIGTSYISKTEKTQFELRSSREGTTPTGDEYIRFYCGDSADDVYKPKLEVSYNAPPTNDACDSDSTFYVNSYSWSNLTVSDVNGVANLKIVDIQVNTTGDAETFTLRWTQATNTFSEVSDSSAICTLDVSTSTRVNVDSDTDKIAFCFMFTSGTAGLCDVKATSTDDNDLTDIDTFADEFTLATNQDPTIGTFQAPSTVYASEYFFLNCSVQDPNGKSEIVNTTIEISNSIILKYDNASDTFSEYQDTNGYCTLDAGNSVRTEVNATAFKLSWKIKLSYSCPEGQISVVVTNTKVYDEFDASGSGSQADLFYFDKKFTLNLRSVDSESDAITDVTVYMDNGTEYSQAPDSQGWANWTAITTSTVDVTVKFYGIQVNSTTITMDDNKTIDLSCECYPFTPTDTKYYVASNATISSATWNSTTKELEIAFSGATATYNLTSSYTSEPTYVLNCTYDIDTDWGTYLSLTHYGNRTITLGYPNWATTRVHRTDHILNDVYWGSGVETIYIVLNGTSGESGTLEVYCGDRGAPISTSGLANGVYFSSTAILAGTYSFASTTTVSIDWTEDTGGGGSTPPNVFITAKTIEIGSIRQGTSITLNATATWTGTRTIILSDVTFDGEGKEWFTAQIDVPLTVERAPMESEGRITVPLTITIPSQGKLGSYSVLIEYEIQVGRSTYQTTANVLFDVVISILPTGGIPDLVSILLLIALVAIPLVWIKRRRH